VLQPASADTASMEAKVTDKPLFIVILPLI
jgi:hypothetical protein